MKMWFYKVHGKSEIGHCVTAKNIIATSLAPVYIGKEEIFFHNTLENLYVWCDWITQREIKYICFNCSGLAVPLHTVQ